MVQRIRGRLGLAAVVVAMGVACQPVDEDLGSAEAGGDEEPDRFGSADYDLAAFEAATDQASGEWDEHARLVEISVRLDDDLLWRAGVATFVAPDADRMLVVEIDEDGMTEQQPTLETLGFIPPPGEALERVPDLPPDVVEPQGAVEAAEEPLDECDISGEPVEILYRTGAPASWDGRMWESEPAWSVTVLAEEGGVVLTTDGAVGDGGCFDIS